MKKANWKIPSLMQPHKLKGIGAAATVKITSADKTRRLEGHPANEHKFEPDNIESGRVRGASSRFLSSSSRIE